MGNSDDSILMYGYDQNSHLNDGVYSQGVSSSAEDMEYNMIAPAMFPTYGMHQNN